MASQGPNAVPATDVECSSWIVQRGQEKLVVERQKEDMVPVRKDITILDNIGHFTIADTTYAMVSTMLDWSSFGAQY